MSVNGWRLVFITGLSGKYHIPPRITLLLANLWNTIINIEVNVTDVQT